MGADWNILAANILKAELKRRGITYVYIPIGTNALSSMKSNNNSGVTRTLIPELRER